MLETLKILQKTTVLASWVPLESYFLVLKFGGTPISGNLHIMFHSNCRSCKVWTGHRPNDFGRTGAWDQLRFSRRLPVLKIWDDIHGG